MSDVFNERTLLIVGGVLYIVAALGRLIIDPGGDDQPVAVGSEATTTTLPELELPDGFGADGSSTSVPAGTPPTVEPSIVDPPPDGASPPLTVPTVPPTTATPVVPPPTTATTAPPPPPAGACGTGEAVQDADTDDIVVLEAGPERYRYRLTVLVKNQLDAAITVVDLGYAATYDNKQGQRADGRVTFQLDGQSIPPGGQIEYVSDEFQSTLPLASLVGDQFGYFSNNDPQNCTVKL